MSDDMEGLTRLPGFFSCHGSGGEWQMWRNQDGFIELWRTRRHDEDGTRHGLERKVTLARTESELAAYFTPRPKAKNTKDPNQIDLIRQADELGKP